MAQRRPQTDKAKATRARSWQRNQEAKAIRIAENEKRHAHNVKVGSTGKQRANAQRKLEKALVNSAAGNVKDLGDFTQYADDNA
jgi:hypothetical protein